MVRHPSERPARERRVVAGALRGEPGEPRTRLLALSAVLEQSRREEHALFRFRGGGKALRDGIRELDRLGFVSAAGPVASEEHSGDRLHVAVAQRPCFFERRGGFAAPAVGGEGASVNQERLGALLSGKHSCRDLGLRHRRGRLSSREQPRRAKHQLASRRLGQDDAQFALHRAGCLRRRVLGVLQPEIPQRLRRLLFASRLAAESLGEHPRHRGLQVYRLSGKRGRPLGHLAGGGEIAGGKQSVGKQGGGAQ